MAAIAASIFPLRYFFSEKKVPSLPIHTTYEEAVVVELPKQIVAQAKKKKCRDYIIPVREVSGDAEFLFNLLDDLNLGLQAFSGWKLRVNDKLKEKMRKRADERFKIWGSMGVGEEMVALSTTQKTVAMKTNYSAVAKCKVLDSISGNDSKLVLSVNDERLQSKLFEISLDFMHPQTLANLNSKRDRKVKQFANLKKSALISLYVFVLIALCYSIYLFFLIVLKIMEKKKKNEFKKYIANEIEKREELINEGHFSTALDLADKFLAEFPYDTEIKAFRSRLLDYTNNDPEKAQQAYVEWKKLQKRMNDPLYASQSNLLSNFEKKNISKLLPYHPELKASYNQLILEDEKKAKAEYDKALKMYDTALNSLKKGSLKDTISKLDTILDIKPDFTKAADLKQRINNFSPVNFAIQKNNKTITEIIVKNSVMIGREDAGATPDILIDDKRVSRKHLTISIVDGAFVIKDLDSSGGTFINGDKVTTAKLKEGDLLTISKIIDYDVSLFKENGGACSGMRLKGRDIDYLFLISRIDFDIHKGEVLVPGKLFSVVLNNGVVVLSTKSETVIPENGVAVKNGDDNYTIEVKNWLI